jgi:hypothetical protein
LRAGAREAGGEDTDRVLGDAFAKKISEKLVATMATIMVLPRRSLLNPSLGS